jgi:hypothetical protein
MRPEAAAAQRRARGRHWSRSNAKEEEGEEDQGLGPEHGWVLMATQVPAVIDELNAALAVLAPILEGDRDYESLNIKDSTKTDVTKVQTANQKRNDLLKAAVDALTALVSDGYPDRPVTIIPAADFADLQDQINTLQAAIKDFQPEGAPVSIEIVFGTPQPK